MAEGTRARLIPVRDLGDRDVAAWRELAAEAAEPNPFFEPDFVVPAVEHLAVARDVVIVAIEDSDGWSACAPGIVGRWRAVVPSFWGLRTPYTYLTTPLVRRGDDGERVSQLIAGAREATGRRALVLERYRSDGPVGAAIEELVADGEAVEALGLTHERALLCRHPDGHYLDWMSKHHARDLRRRRRRLEEDAGRLEVLDLSEDPSAPRAFLDLEQAGWKGREGTAMASREGDAAFFVALCERFRAAGRLEILALRADERTLAMLCNLRSGEGSFSFKIAHDEEYSKFSPGIQLETANADFFHASGSAWMDSCAEPDNAMINRLWPERRRIHTIVLAPADRRGVILRAALGAASSLRRMRRS